MMDRLKNFFIVVPEDVNDGDHAEYYSLFYSAFIGTNICIILLIAFLIAQIPIMIFFAVTGIAISASGVYVVRKGNTLACVYLGLWEMMMHIGAMVIVLGHAYGLQHMLWWTILYNAFNAKQSHILVRVIGVLVLIEIILLYNFVPYQTDIRPFEEHLNVIYVFGILCAGVPIFASLIAIKFVHMKQKEELRQQIYRDELTQLYNRKFVVDLFEYETKAAEHSKEPFCFCLFDIDHFKQVNDQYGHNVGDEVLKEVASFFIERVHSKDIMCRWGGEEFLLILTGCDLRNAEKITNSLLVQLQDKILSSARLNVTLSGGLVQVHDNVEFDDALKIADENLYLAKENGRNRIVSQSSVN